MNLRRLFGIVASLLIIAGCASQPANNSSSPAISWQSIKSAAHHAATSKQTWVPLLGAALFTIDDWDQKAVDWASRKTPIFGSRLNAQHKSDDFNNLGQLNLILSALIVPNQGDDSYLVNHLERLLLDFAAVGVSSTLNTEVKDASHRLRPDGSDYRSFPSGHASRAASQAVVSRYNIEHMTQFSTRTRDYWAYSTTGLAMLTAWARVEGEKHYPSDVMAGYALGNFVGQFVSDAFILPLLDSSPALEEYTFINLDLLVEKQIYVEFAFRW